MDLSKYQAKGQQLAAYFTKKPAIYNSVLWVVNKVALVIGFLCLPITLLKDRGSK